MPDITTVHPDLTATCDQRERCRDLTAGSDAVKGAGTKYLPRPAGMDDADYDFYKERAQYYNALARTTTALAGAVLRQPANVEVPESMRQQLDDVTLRDEPFDAIAQRVVTELLSVGRHAMFVEMPAAQEAAAPGVPTEGKLGTRPYWVTIPAERVINWRTDRVGSDPEQLVLVVYKEDARKDPNDPYSHETEEQYRELALVEGKYQTRTWAKNKGQTDSIAEYTASPWVIPTRRGAPLTFIPFTFVGTDGVTPDVTRPPLVDLADLSVGHYRNSADLEHGLFYTAIPTFYASGVSGEGQLRVGGSVVWRLGDAGKAGVVEVTGAGLKEIREAMGAKERQMATLGARMLEDAHASGAATATEVLLTHSGESASLRTIAGAASAALTRMLRWHVWWFTGTGDLTALNGKVRADLPREFFQVKASPEEIKAAILAIQAGEISYDTFYSILEKGGWAREGVTAEDEKKAIKAELPPPVDDPNADPNADPNQPPKPGDPPKKNPAPPDPAPKA